MAVFTEASAEPLRPGFRQASCGGSSTAVSPSAPRDCASGYLGDSQPERTYSLEVPPGTWRLTVTLDGAGDSLDLDLLVGRGAQPAADLVACRSARAGSRQECSIDDPQPGTWFLQASRSAGQGVFELTATTFLEEAAACVRDAETACLQDGRFQVRVAWNNGTHAGTAKVMSFGAERTENDETVFYSFQSPITFEMGVKVLDACIPLFGEKFWVFVSGLTDQGWQVTVRDTRTGAIRTYGNTSGNLSETFADIFAFDC